MKLFLPANYFRKMTDFKQGNALVALTITAALLMIIFIAAWPGRSQSTVTQRTTPTEPTSSSTKLTSAPSKPNSPTAATLENAALKHNLEWAFGGKQQRGWYLYKSLVNQLLATDRDASTSEFTTALARWQANAGLAPTGILDDETWYKMVSTWQSRRLKDRSYPQAHQVLTVPASDFWDQTRAAELRQVEVEAYAAYKRMVAAAAADPTLGLLITSTGELDASEKYLKIISSFRSREYQEQLRKQSPNAGRAGLALNSPHFTGRALDIYVGGEPVETKDSNRALQVQTPVYKWLVKNAERFGFRPYYYEPWHWEYCPNC